MVVAGRRYYLFERSWLNDLGHLQQGCALLITCLEMSFLLRDRAALRTILSSPCRPRYLSIRAPFFPGRPSTPFFAHLTRQNTAVYNTLPSRFFSSTHVPKNPGPYPHRQYRNHERNRPEFLSSLERMPQDTIFWGIMSINGVVFVMWYLSTQRWV